jgi:HK97 family phage major capsid protein
MDKETEQFEKQVLDGIEAVRTKADTLVANYDRLTKETKQAFDDVTALKKTANDTAANMLEMQRRLIVVDERLKQEVRMAYGDPIQRICRDEELCLRMNLAVRLALSKEGDLVGILKKHAPQELLKRALGEDSSPGSTLINTALANEVYDTLSSYGIWNTFGVRRLGTKTTTYPVKTVRPIATHIVTESDTISDDTNKAGTSVNLTAVVIAVLLNVSLQLLQDAEFDVTRDVLEDFGEAFAYRLDWDCTQADGTADATDGGNTGIFGGGGTAATAAAGNVTVEQTDDADWRRALLTVDEAVLTRPARWWMNRQILVRMLGIKDGNGRPIFNMANEVPTPGGIGSIFGYPVTLGSVCPTTNAASAKVAVFGDPAGLVVGIRNDFQMEASDHHKWNTLQRSFRGYGRAGVKIRRAQGLAVLTLA